MLYATKPVLRTFGQHLKMKQWNMISFTFPIADQLPDCGWLAPEEGVAVDGREPFRADPHT